MSIPRTELKRRALAALEEAVQEARWRRPRRSMALRFALAFLWSAKGGGERGAFVEYWQALVRDDMWRFAAADRALAAIHSELGLARDEEAAMAIWRKLHDQEQARS